MTRDEAKACVGAGWSHLIDVYFDMVDQFDDGPLYDAPMVVSVTNRIGMLNIKATCTHPVIQDMLTRLAWSLERDSAKVCEVCGKKGFRRKALPGSPNRCTPHYIELVNQA